VLRQRRDRGSFVEDKARHEAENSSPRRGQDSKNSALRSLEVKQLPRGLHHWFVVNGRSVGAVGGLVSGSVELSVTVQILLLWELLK